MRVPPIRFRARGHDAPLAALYAGRAPFHWAGAGDEREPLTGVSVFLNEAGPHWHYVGFGLRDRAGFGFELTFRLAPAEESGAAPRWPVRLLNEFARHAIGSGQPFEPGHYLCLPEAVDPAREVRCAAVVPDPQLPVDEGSARWLQLVGLHEDELPWMSGARYERLLGELRRREPLLVTAPGRPASVPR